MQALLGVHWKHFLLQLLLDSEFPSVLQKQMMLTSEVSLQKLMPRQVLDKSFEHVHGSELDSKEKFVFSFRLCCIISTVRDTQ